MEQKVVNGDRLHSEAFLRFISDGIETLGATRTALLLAKDLPPHGMGEATCLTVLDPGLLRIECEICMVSPRAPIRKAEAQAANATMRCHRWGARRTEREGMQSAR